MNNVYLPSCRFTGYSTDTSTRVITYLLENHNVKVLGCCTTDYDQPGPEDRLIYICNTCAHVGRESSNAGQIVSIWEIIDQDENFTLPDYKGEKMAIQDCWRSRENRKVQYAIRSILEKMNIDYEEMEENYQNTNFCGTSLYKKVPEKYYKLAPKKLSKIEEDYENLGPDQIHEKMQDHVSNVQADKIITHCVTCTQGLEMTDKTPIHLMDLIMAQR